MKNNLDIVLTQSLIKVDSITDHLMDVLEKESLDQNHPNKEYLISIALLAKNLSEAVILSIDELKNNQYKKIQKQ